MNLEILATTSVKWLWEAYGKELTNKAVGELKKRWQKFKWQDAEAKYRARLREQHSVVRLLTHYKAIPIEDIFTDVYVLDKPTAHRRYDLTELQNRPLERSALNLDSRRIPALRLVTTEKRLFILGKPGAGKTTLLRFLALQACAGKIPRTPIFVWLREWAESEKEIIPFIIQQFEICAFPDAQAFIEHLLETGNALVLFDGLDEVNQAGRQRDKIISNLVTFAKRYPEVQICVTCRTAATDFSFEQFTYLEIADFDDKQVQLFVRKWYRDEQIKLSRFMAEFEKPENVGIKELAKTPLLLALLCLAFDETLSFPSRRADLYKEALDALLRKWDSSRGIHRDEIYRKLSPMRKEQLLARLAYENFDAGIYFIRKDKLSQQIADYLQQLPSSDREEEPDGEAVLKAIQEQHGVLVEQAHNIYSFAHLTFQEYFTARYIVENASRGTINHVLRDFVTDNRWREVLLLTASLLDNADVFFEAFLDTIKGLIQKDETYKEMLEWSNEKAATSKGEREHVTRAIWLTVAIAKAFDRANDRVRVFSHALARDRDLACFRHLFRWGAA